MANTGIPEKGILVLLLLLFLLPVVGPLLLAGQQAGVHTPEMSGR